MRGHELLDKMSLVEAKYLAEAEALPLPRQERRTKWILPAAAACLAAALGLVFALREPLPPRLPGPFPLQAGETPQTTLSPGSISPAASAAPLPSEKYTRLEDLLAHLSLHDDHTQKRADSNGSFSAAESAVSGEKAVLYEGYTYCLTTEGLTVCPLNGDTAVVLPIQGEQLFLTGDRLAVADSFSTGEETNPQISVRLQLYSLQDPLQPALFQEITQRGSLLDCHSTGDALWLFTADGECACGFSREKDLSAYQPRLQQAGEPLPWEEEEIFILGEPSRVYYVAMSRISLQEGTLAEKKAFYGDISRLFYGPGWLALLTETRTETTLRQPELYLFDTENACSYSGKLSAAALCALPEEVSLKEGVLPQGRYPQILSVDRCGDTYRLLGTVEEVTAADNTTALLAAAAIPGGKSTVSTLPLAVHSRIDDLFWEEDRAILCVTGITLTEEPDVWEECAFYFADFTGETPVITAAQVPTAVVTGIDMLYSYGSPLGALRTLIPLGEGRYLRYNSLPNGFDLYALSGEPRRLAGGLGELPNGGRYEFRWEVYSTDTFGVLCLYPAGEGYRELTYAWRVYRIAADGTCTLLREIPLSSAAAEYPLLQQEGNYYAFSPNGIGYLPE